MEKTEIEAYREKVLQALMSREGADEEAMKDLLGMLTDEDLAFGMPYNTPEETAQMLLDD